MRAAGSGIPGKSVDDVRQHDEWYSEYLILKDSKKKAIQEWKDIKEVGWFLYEQLARPSFVPKEANGYCSERSLTSKLVPYSVGLQSTSSSYIASVRIEPSARIACLCSFMCLFVMTLEVIKHYSIVITDKSSNFV